MRDFVGAVQRANGPGSGIRTHGLLLPKQARYQTAPCPDVRFIIALTNLSFKNKISVASLARKVYNSVK